jgi:hypothetical protein
MDFMVTKKLNRYTIIVFVISITLLLVLLFNFLVKEENAFIRQFQFIIGYFITLPLIFISTILVLTIIKYFIANKISPNIKLILMLLPYALFMLYFITIILLSVL